MCSLLSANQKRFVGQNDKGVEGFGMLARGIFFSGNFEEFWRFLDQNRLKLVKSRLKFG